MSTAYRIAGRGRRFTKPALSKISIEEGWTWKEDKKKQSIVVKTLGGYLHLYKTGHVAYNAFERFGGNNPYIFIRTLLNKGYTIYSEHHVDFWRCRGRK